MPAATHEQRALARAREPRTRGKPCPNRFARMATDRNHTDLASLAEHLDEPAFEIDVRDRERAELREAQPRRIGQLQHGPVAQAQRIVAVELHQHARAIRIERVRQPPRRLRRTHRPSRIAGHHRFAHAEIEEGPQRREPALDRASAHRAPVPPRHESPHDPRVDRGPLGNLHRLDVSGEHREVTAIPLHGMDREPALVAQVTAEPPDPLVTARPGLAGGSGLVVHRLFCGQLAR